MRTRVVLLGTGTPNAEVERSGPSVGVVVDDRSYIFDAGPGVVRRANAAYRRGVEALCPDRLERVFLTHLHSDHTTGLPDLLLAPWVLGRNEPMKVFGPRGTRSMMKHIHKAYSDDIEVRTKGLENANDEGHRFDVEEVEPGIVYEDDLINVKAFEVRHTSFRHALGYRIEGPDRSVAVSGDCAPAEGLLENYRDLDVLVHEIYSTKGFESRDPGWRRYHCNSHTSSKELAGILKEVRPGLTVLYHQLMWGASPDDLLDEIEGIYKGRVVFGNDLDVF